MGRDMTNGCSAMIFGRFLLGPENQLANPKVRFLLTTGLTSGSALTMCMIGGPGHAFSLPLPLSTSLLQLSGKRNLTDGVERFLQVVLTDELDDKIERAGIGRDAVEDTDVERCRVWPWCPEDEVANVVWVDQYGGMSNPRSSSASYSLVEGAMKEMSGIPERLRRGFIYDGPPTARDSLSVPFDVAWNEVVQSDNKARDNAAVAGTHPVARR